MKAKLFEFLLKANLRLGSRAEKTRETIKVLEEKPWVKSDTLDDERSCTWVARERANIRREEKESLEKERIGER